MNKSALDQVWSYIQHATQPMVKNAQAWGNTLGITSPNPQTPSLVQTVQRAQKALAPIAQSIGSAVQDVVSGPKYISPIPNSTARNQNIGILGALGVPPQQKGAVKGATIGPLPTPTTEPLPHVPPGWSKPIRVHPTVSPTPSAPSPVIPVPQDNPYYFDFNGYTVQTQPNKTIPQPPQDIAKIIFDIFNQAGEATPAAAVAWAENGSYNPRAVNPHNLNGTTDYGIFQINSGTFDGLKKRRPAEMAAIGAHTYEDLYDPLINARVAELVRKDEEWNQAQGYNVADWGQWYGWREPPLGKGVNLQKMVNKILASVPKKKKK